MILLSTHIIHAQISPGDLSQPHAHMEGMRNCTECHDLGNKVPDQKCLACHTEIDALIRQNRGYHVSNEVTSKTCVNCHNDHHGRKFEMIRFDEQSFNHKLAGYPLQGKHATIDCRQCHQADNISNTDLKKREGTFLGLDDKCLTCHEDFHQNTLSSNCIQCHGFESFRPATGFNHNDAQFKLTGAHNSVSCLECHPMIDKKGKEFQQFTGLAFKDCINCHNDPHLGNIPGSCVQCHTTTSFTQLIDGFNHNKTTFTLKGKHTTVNCFDCHTETSNPKIVFQENLGIPENDCNKCHDDVHDGKFGLDCARCHTEESFYDIKAINDFDHSVTDFPLEGLHIGVDCKSCHEDRYTTAIDFSQCKNCHDDYHNGQFSSNGRNSDCNECHVLTEDFTYTTFGLDQHQKAAFALEGSHIATPCFACHVSEDHWSFRNIGQSCVDCHEDIHKDYIDPQFYPNSDCTTCHNATSWNDTNFDHTKTDWSLEGSHATVDCRSCHLLDTNSSFTEGQKFKDLSTSCTTCHENIHGNQFAENGITDCRQCHDTESWFPNNFDHNKTQFPLEGKHAEIDCRACHYRENDSEGKEQVIYKLQKFECIDCHS